MHSMLYITASSMNEAKTIVDALMEEKLIACANMFPIHSVYRWKGKIEKDEEVAIIAKTRASLVQKAIERVKELHSYEVPCVVEYSIANGDLDYLDWIQKETTQ